MIITTTTLNAILIHVHEYWNPFILNLAELDSSKNGILTAAAKCKYASGMFVNLGERTGDKKRALEANIKKKNFSQSVSLFNKSVYSDGNWGTAGNWFCINYSLTMMKEKSTYSFLIASQSCITLLEVFVFGNWKLHANEKQKTLHSPAKLLDSKERRHRTATWKRLFNLCWTIGQAGE